MLNEGVWTVSAYLHHTSQLEHGRCDSTARHDVNGHLENPQFELTLKKRVITEKVTNAPQMVRSYETIKTHFPVYTKPLHH